MPECSETDVPLAKKSKVEATAAHPGAAAYATALDGLQLEDPVAAFFDFCKERELIRHRRASGAAAPWTDNAIFQKARFLNVFREDDRVTKVLLRFVEPIAKHGDLSALVHALFFARWCNRDTILESISSDLLKDPAALKLKLQQLPAPWCNETAYPVEDVTWEGTTHNRWESATKLFAEIAPTLADMIKKANGDVQHATDLVNEKFQMENDFPIFMAVMDIAWFRPDIINPSSPVPVGIGAVAFVKRLRSHLKAESDNETFQQMIKLQPKYWPDAKRAFEPIDIEYLSCECRKYYSYVNGTKLFEGKNVFVAGKSPTL